MFHTTLFTLLMQLVKEHALEKYMDCIPYIF